MYDVQVSVLVWHNWKTPVQGIDASRRSAVEASASQIDGGNLPQRWGLFQAGKIRQADHVQLSVGTFEFEKRPRMSRPIVFTPLRGACSSTDKARRPSRHQPR